MFDPRMRKLADVLVDHSVRLQKGETVYIEAFDMPVEMVEVLLSKIYEVGGIPLVALRSARIFRKLLKDGDHQTIQQIGEVELEKMKRAQAYIGMRGSFNITENSDVPADKMDMYNKLWWGPVHSDWRVPKTKWVILRWPTSAMAQQAQMSTEAFEDFYFNTCTLDYSKMSMAMDPLVDLLERTDKVRIVGPGTDLSFSIKDIPVVKCDGERNIPDGEVYTAPVKDSVNGVISYNAKTLYQGKPFENVVLRFKDGKVIEAKGSDTKGINTILDTDEGARYVGEFAIGVNPFINQAMLDTLFDEKIAGSIHFTPGKAYQEADNGNRSTVHWDMVLVQTPEFGGGEIYFDGVLVRKDGRFVVDELKGLNPENLV
jgi:aminopeptidase